MILERNLAGFVVFSDETLVTALQKITNNKSGLVFVTDASGVLEGVMTDGDFRRWLVTQPVTDLGLPVALAANRNFQYALDSDSPDAIAQKLSKRITHLPVVDAQRRLVAVASGSAGSILIGRHTIDHQSRAFLIAEIGNNHNGSLDSAFSLVDAAHGAGADCAKFQFRVLDSLYRSGTSGQASTEDLGSEYTLDLLRRFQLSRTEMFKVFDHCKKLGMEPLCTPWDVEALKVLESYGMAAYKLASADLTNPDLIEAIALTGKPVIVSTGMSNEPEIERAVDQLNRVGAQYILLHCNSTYPAPFKDVNLRYLDRLAKLGNGLVGYSGHERGYSIAVAAVALGAKVIEKHFTLDRTLEGNDHRVSLLPDEFREMVRAVREVEEGLGSSDPRRLTQGEMMNRETLAKSLVATRQLKRGEVIEAEAISVRSPGRGLAPYRKPELIGKLAVRDMAEGEFFYPEDLVASSYPPRKFLFKRPFGIPVRYHDLAELLPLSNLDLVEFHLSYKDLEADFGNLLASSYDLGLVVHSPELFAGDHLMDLSSLDAEYRRQSIAELQRVVDLTRQLKPRFNSGRPMIIINAGGFSLDGALPVAQRQARYDRIAEALASLDSDGVEIIPQTMPPFPWHFGGQRYHNLFVDGAEIAKFCQEHSYRVCLDVSHSKLACNFYHQSFQGFLDLVAPHSAHLHIVDALGVDGEGLQIGTGDIDFVSLCRTLDALAPRVSFIPEVWQGHKAQGAGFWEALTKLEASFNNARSL